MFRKLLNSFRNARTPHVPRTLYAPNALRGIDGLIEQVDRVWEARRPKVPKVLPKTAA